MVARSSAGRIGGIVHVTNEGEGHRGGRDQDRLRVGVEGSVSAKRGLGRDGLDPEREERPWGFERRGGPHDCEERFGERRGWERKLNVRLPGLAFYKCRLALPSDPLTTHRRS